jgi:UDPglucose--hexose-1-phosphate uridylyltransferase
MYLDDYTHTRYNPLTGEWLLVSPHRAKRPWQGKIEEKALDTGMKYDPSCYLCPGNERAGGIKNPQYKDIFIFVNDFSALLGDIPDFANDDLLLKAKSERGICKVICFSPEHNLTLALMKNENIKKVIDAWINEYIQIGNIDYINYVQIFENHGAMMGCSNPHPHCQIWANETIPVIPYKEDINQKEYMNKHNTCLLCDYIEKEKTLNERIIFENDSFIVLIPFWAVWPFETMVLPKSHLESIDLMNEKQKNDYADAIRLIGIKYDNIFRINFPYSMGIHQKPTNKESHGHWHFHMHYYPPLLRSATIQKFMVGYELMANPQRDITPEKSALILKNQEDIHFINNKSGE